MSLDQIMAWLLAAYGLTLAVVITLQIVGASLYDMGLARQLRDRRAHPYAKAYRQRPLVSVIIIASNQAYSIEACLDSLRRGSYRKLQLLIVDDMSTDDTKARVKAYLNRYPKLNARLIARRRPATWSSIIGTVYRRYAKGELIVALDGDASLDKQALKQAVEGLQLPDTDVIVPSLRPADRSMGSLIQTYRLLLSERSRKLSSLLRRSPSLQGVLICRRSVLPAILRHNRRNPVATSLPTKLTYGYLPDCVINAVSINWRPVMPSSRWTDRTVAALQALTAVLTPVILTYFGYLALSLKEPTFLLLSLAGLTLLLCFAIWEDDRLRFRQRLAYTIGIPVTYGWFYIRTWLQLSIACKVLIKPFAHPAE